MPGIIDKPVTSGVNNGGITDMGNGLMMYVGTGAFTTTGATVVVYHPFGTGAIYSAIAQFTETTVDADDSHIGFKQGATAGLINRDATYGYYNAVTPGQATVQRNGTSGLTGATFSIIMIGRARH